MIITGADITLTVDGIEIPVFGDVTYQPLTPPPPVLDEFLLSDLVRHEGTLGPIVMLAPPRESIDVTVTLTYRLRRWYPKRWSRAKRKAARARNLAGWVALIDRVKAEMTEERP